MYRLYMLKSCIFNMIPKSDLLPYYGILLDPHVFVEGGKK